MTAGTGLQRRAVLGAAASLAVLAPFGARAAGSFAQWLEEFRRSARSSGITEPTITRALGGLQPLSKVIELDHRQPEATLSFADYVRLTVSQRRIDEGRALFASDRTLLAQTQRRYGVSAPILLALWAMESEYGRHMGDFPVVAALATLAYDARRAAFFRGELLAALRILDRHPMAPSAMTGSWAGAMGQIQFMPSSYLSYAVHAAGPGRPDIWNDPADVLASAANYLAREGWAAGEGWGQEVRLPPGFDSRVGGAPATRTAADWRAVGVQGLGAAPPPGTPASIVRPDGVGGRAFMVYRNYRVILRWNRSDYFAVAVGLLADRIGAAANIR